MFKKEEEQPGGKLDMCVIVQGVSVGTLDPKEISQDLDALLNSVYTIHVTWTFVNQSALGGFRINLLALYHKCRPLIGYATHVLSNN